MMPLFLVLLLSFLLRGEGFAPVSTFSGILTQRQLQKKNDVRPSLKLQAFGMQKLGERVAAQAPDTVGTGPEVEVPGDLKRISQFSSGGCDERFEHKFDGGLYTDEEATTLINIDKALRQQSLLMTLGERSSLGAVDKMARVQLAAKNGLLPPSLDPDAMLGHQIKSGGLFKDWDFDM